MACRSLIPELQSSKQYAAFIPSFTCRFLSSQLRRRSMPSRRESVLQALLAVLTTVPGASVERETAIPERVPQGGLIILRDGDPGTPEVILSPLTYLYDHAARLEVFAQAGQPAARAIAIDGLLRAIGTALVTDRSLGGNCDWLAWAAPAVEDLPVAGGGSPIRAATVIVTLTYSTSDPLG
ncbi:MAG: acyl-CoA transferase [Rhodospirillaceae bacterium]